MSALQKKHQFIHGQPSMGLPFQKELVVDLFAGGGGGCPGHDSTLVVNAHDLVSME
ncbi:hypothetical protein [Pseudomonas sp. BIC9C]|uniref:hypothetical protein n=1 Tax=Pseudomonas sp. BIC9C TaxID=3078458 RepID=UPI002AD24EFE|nr:hypothetical protein [Pseudomonas sp. BIC9C]